MTNRPKLKAGARKHIAGLNQHELSLGVMHVTAAVVQASYDSTEENEQAYQTARGDRKAALKTQKTARAAALAFAEQARDALSPFLGRYWSVAWTQAGFKNNSLALPDTLPQLVDT